MLPRVLEPEVMDTAEEAEDYDSMDHSQVNRRFVEDWIALRDFLEWSVPGQLRLLDVGTGTALIPIEFCRQVPDLDIVAVDLADEMLRLGNRNVKQAGFGERITLQKVDAKCSPFLDDEFPTVVSNSIIHHIPQPLDCFRDLVRVLQPGGLLMVRDLMRPETAAEVEEIVAMHAAEASARQQQLFRQSLHAALTVSEVQAMLEELGLPTSWVRATSDRHWTITGMKPA